MGSPTVALTLLLLAAATGVRGQSSTTYKLVPPPIPQSSLPDARPPLWAFRTLADSRVSFKNFSTGAMQLTVVHKPLSKVTPTMALWLWQNLARASAVSPLDNATYPLFLLMHPRDHAKHTSNLAPEAYGAYTTFQEFPLTGCGGDGGGISPSASANWRCPTGAAGDANPGYLSSTDPAVWNASTVEKTNGNPWIQSLSKSQGKVSFYTNRCNEQNQCADVIQTVHTFSWAKATNTTSWTTTLLVGLSWYQPSTQRIINGWRGDMDAYTKFWRQALHFTEEIGALDQWLPQAWAAANPPPPPKGRRMMMAAAPPAVA